MSNGSEGFDGEVGETYLQPASRRKGRRELPGWRDPDWAAGNWRYVRRVSRYYFVGLMVPILLLLWGSGYAAGLLANCAPPPARHETISKESPNVR